MREPTEAEVTAYEDAMVAAHPVRTIRGATVLALIREAGLDDIKRTPVINFWSDYDHRYGIVFEVAKMDDDGSAELVGDSIVTYEVHVPVVWSEASDDVDG